jgi:acyl-CoA synthetase (NDP forming)/GNAT superfamily N-acetyltransferase
MGAEVAKPGIDGGRAGLGYDVLLRDGGIAHVRAVAVDDWAGLLALHEELSPDSAYLRFFTASRYSAERYVRQLARPASPGHFAVVATVGDRIVGVAGYECLNNPATAEVAFAVADDQHRRGVGTLLLEHLASTARAHGVTRFTAEVLAQNADMLDVLAHAGFAVSRRRSDGVVDAQFPLKPDERYLRATEGREEQADAASLAPLLRPRTVAVVGAGRRPHSVGHETLVNILASGFDGAVYPVNGKGGTIAGRPAYPSIAEVPEAPDLVVIAVSASEVPAVVRACAERGARSLVVLSAGFAEAGPDGAALEHRVVAAARRGGMRLVGPNCMGVLVGTPERRLNATFSPSTPPAGRVGFLSQSGGLGIGMLQQAAALGIGLSTFVSVGNKADVSGNDLLLWWEQDENTDLVVLYLESFGNPRKFARIARRVSQKKPIVAVKGGASSAGSRAARSHTAAAATPRRTVDALFEQAGIIAVDSLGEVFDTVAVLAHQPLPGGMRLGIVGNAGGPGVLAADAAAAAGLELPPLTGETQAALRAVLPVGAAVSNPVDTIASVSGEAMEAALRLVLADPGIDAVLAIVTPTPLTEQDALPRAVRAAAGGTGRKPLVATVLGQPAPVTTMPGESGEVVPSFAYPEAAVRTLARAARYGRWRRRPAGRLLGLPDSLARGARTAVVEPFLAVHPEGGWLDPAAANRLMAAYGVPCAPVEYVRDAQEARAAASRQAGPVSLKVASERIVHKTDVGGVALDLRGPDQVAAAFLDMRARLGDAMEGAVVQPMVSTGPGTVETVVGMVDDPAFGPLVMFGLGGVLTDLIDDRAFRLVPLTDLDAAELVGAVRAAPLLAGYRGAPAVDVGALTDLVQRVARMAQDIPEIAEMDLNPVLVNSGGATAVDVKVRLVPGRGDVDPYLRHLR